MKNKEIEELLNKFKIVLETYKDLKVEPTLCEELITTGELSLLLSYIEQLEKRNKEIYDGFMATQEELSEYATKNEQLENNRDKAIELLNIGITTYNNGGSRTALFGVIEDSRDILKGDSDD